MNINVKYVKSGSLNGNGSNAANKELPQKRYKKKDASILIANIACSGKARILLNKAG